MARTSPTSLDEKFNPPYFLSLTVHSENILSTHKQIQEHCEEAIFTMARKNEYFMKDNKDQIWIL